MKNLKHWPEKVVQAAMSPTTPFYIVINAVTGKPQYFSINTHKTEAYGEFMDVDLSEQDEAAAGVFDRETALYLIGQSSISAMIDIEEAAKGGGEYQTYAQKTPTYLLVPVYGSMLPIVSPSIQAR